MAVVLEIEHKLNGSHLYAWAGSVSLKSEYPHGNHNFTGY